ncbi:ATP-binding protein [Phytoactinopolyspora halotolerans]|uniref:AAA family ATPase n=1 Tax=Phytoactinopolyspora halotolerans TaxID=1981512 RepID=A0A6L9S7B6_9ACTN|nr:ATP-binding protein [Phytoactinopolyspora halotolerans]NEE00867.1 AAA family ATPase [Phytoactinopolyspora halotolerans]
MDFVNRVDELAQLQEWWETPEVRPALIWGRRRVGKTALIAEFAARTRARTVFHIAGTRSATAELVALSQRATAVTSRGRRSPSDRPYESWDDALDHLAEQAADEPVLLVLDEFPELIQSSPELPGVLRAFLDHPVGTGRLRILICGSAVRTMLAMQEYRAPLYGRFDLVMQVHPFRPHEAAQLLPNLSPADRAFVYGVLGGTPLYLSWWRQDVSIQKNLLRLACRPGARLLAEGELVLATEVDPGDYPAAVLEAIATGKTRHHEIADAVGAEPSRTLRRLRQLRLVEQLLPVTESERRTRRKIYQISDPFLAFFLGPLQRYRTEIEQGLGERIVDALIDSLSEHMGRIYEEAFRNHLRRLAAAGDLGRRVVAVGPWWSEGGQDQIDAVVLSEPDRTRVPVLVGESKWSRKVDARRLRAKLTAKASKLTDDVDTLTYAICARDEVTNADEGVLTVTAADIYGLAEN